MAQRKKITVHLSAESLEWLDQEKVLRTRTRSATIETAVDLLRVLRGLSELGAMAATAEEVANPNGRPLSRLLRQMAKQRFEEELKAS